VNVESIVPPAARGSAERPKAEAVEGEDDDESSAAPDGDATPPLKHPHPEFAGVPSEAEAPAMCHVLDPKAITTYKEYQAALSELDELMLADPDTPSGRRFGELVALIDAYELSREPTMIRVAAPARATA